MRGIILLAFLPMLLACSALPQTFPANAARKSLDPINESRVVVKQDLKIAPSLTALVLPADTYVPVRTDRAGTYYESPRGIMLVPVAGAPLLVPGGIYRSSDPAQRYQLSIYGAPITWPLNVRYGAHLQGVIECTPTCESP